MQSEPAYENKSFFDITETFAKYLTCKPFYVDQSVQCDLFLQETTNEIDPKQLTYKKRIQWHLKEFCYKTTSHGILMLGSAPNAIYRYSWVVLLTVSLSMFLLQAVSVIAKYYRNEKNTIIELIFDTAPFPAITICNLNPYSKTMVEDVDVVKKVFKVFNEVMTEASKANSKSSRDVQPLSVPEKNEFLPAWSDCICIEGSNRLICHARMRIEPPSDDQMCLCAFDKAHLKIQSCYPNDEWELNYCKLCNSSGFCEQSENAETSDIGQGCLCQRNDPTCLSYNPDNEPLKTWEFFKTEGRNVDADIVESMGFENMRDEVAIVTKANENIIFAMAELPEEKRRSLSTEKKFLIQKCSFNGIECNIENDFSLVQNPTFGNCYTFNHNRTENKTTLRAGPMYGLRLLMYVNASEYLPITEAVGIKITIHDKDEYPFPDTFGYNAPTGYISSFGMRMVRVARLPAPFSDCVVENTPENYYFQKFRYSTEGCYRSCIQNKLIRECGCGDPRYPIRENEHHCSAFDPVARKCLQEQANGMSTNNENLKCRCQQPCYQSTYTVSYSAGIWPSEALNITFGNCQDGPESCNEHYQENGVMVEVFYEALNYEIMAESESYGLVKLLSDFGGQLGLWSGISFITCCEFFFLLCEILYIVCNHYVNKHRGVRVENGTRSSYS